MSSPGESGQCCAAALRLQRKTGSAFLDFSAADLSPGVLPEWNRTILLPEAFLLKVGSAVYDWSTEGRLRQFKEQLGKLQTSRDNVIPLIRETMETWTPEVMPEEIGHVLTVGDDIATVSGLEHAAYGEILLFTARGCKGMVQDLRRGSWAASSLAAARPSPRAAKSAAAAGWPASRWATPSWPGHRRPGSPIDGKGEIEAQDYRPMETAAPEIIDRQPVDQPMETGILAIDSMFPIGRGQRELIIGDRQTGKTAIAVDTILNQKGKDVVCIYVAIGQKASSVAQVVETLEKRGAMEYCVVISAAAGDSAPCSTLPPYAGCSLGEFFHEQGQGCADGLR